ncbi:MAG: dihydrolipoamide acetyltransferase family protein [Chloroflexota bacterium]
MPSIKLFVPEDDIGEVEEAVVVTWLKREGDSVKKGEELVIIQAEKVSFELPAPANGTLTSILVPQGEVVKQNQPLAEFEVSETDSSPPPEQLEPQSPAATATATSAPTPAREVRASPIAKRLARQHGIDLGQVVGTGKEGRITEKDIQTFIDAETAAVETSPPSPTAQPANIRSSPIARRIAKEHQIDLAAIPGAGERRLTEKDVRAFIEARQSQSLPSEEPASASPLESRQTIPMAGMRAAIAKRMHQSLQETAQLTLHTEADVTELVALRTQLKEKLAVTYTDFLVRASVNALQEHPYLNATLKDDTIHLLSEIHIGLAVALDSGLIVPVIKNADQKTLADLASERARLIKQAKSNQLTPAEFTGSTFTITNLGTYDIDAFTPIVNPPEVAILGVGRIVEKVVIFEGKIAQRSMITLSLSFDHRLVDGAPAAAFLQSIKRHLEQPAGLE